MTATKPDWAASPRSSRELTWQVVRNHEFRYAIWRADFAPPAGWHRAGGLGDRAACLAEICELSAAAGGALMRPADATIAKDGSEGSGSDVAISLSSGAFEASVVSAVARVVQEQPDAPAVIDSAGAISYAELWSRAGELAERLRPLVTGPEAVVGFSGARDAAFPVAVLGILRAGACYLPIAADWPEKRMDTVLRDAACVALVDQSLGIRERSNARPTNRQVAAQPLDQQVPLSRTAAYMVFTSGSTGAPKGVVIEHGALLNNCRGSVERYGVTATDRVLQFTGLGIDISLEELFVAWLAGAPVVLSTEDVPASLVAFSEFLAANLVSILDLPVSFLTTWLTAIERGHAPRPPSCVRVVAVGSDQVPTGVIERWLSVAPDSTIANAFGATETAITPVIYGPKAVGEPIEADAIGYPIANVTAYVLDDKLQRVADGEYGELYIGGAAVARGYVGQPALTAERFLPDPFSDEIGACMYRSRDEVRRHPDGCIEFSRRLDRRQKVAGHTVEPAEVESIIAAVAGVDAVTVDTGPSGKLVATVRPVARSQSTQWREIYDLLYEPSASTVLSTMNTAGWVSSLDHQPYSTDEMRRWRDTIVDSLVDGRVGRVYEIGCGTGILVHALAALADEYVAVDISPVALGLLQRSLETAAYRDKVRAQLGEALAIADEPEAHYDTVMINSVVQHFSGSDHLTACLEAAARTIRPGGRLFVGDVRNLVSAEMAQGMKSFGQIVECDSIEAVENAVVMATSQESELLVAPSFFWRLRELAGRPVMSSIRMKPLEDLNEMTLVRFDVELQFDTPQSSSEGWVMDASWSAFRDVATAARALRQHGGGTRVRGVPDRRIDRLAERRRSPQRAWLKQRFGIGDADRATGPESPTELVRALQSGGSSAAIVPGALPGTVDVVCHPSDVRLVSALTAQDYEGSTSSPGTNQLRGADVGDLRRRISRAFTEHLPGYMWPELVITDDMADGEAGVEPAWSDSAHAALLDLWREELGGQEVSSGDDFFEMGGNSLGAMQILTMVHRQLGVSIRFRDFFVDPTIDGLVALVRKARSAAPEVSNEKGPTASETAEEG